MKIEATVKQIRALLQLAEPSKGAGGRTLEAVPRGLPRLLLERYHSLIDAGRTPAVVAIVGGACSGCHMRLPTMVEYTARRSPALHVCSHCRRMLYAPELVHEDSHADDGTPSPRAAEASTARRS